MSAPRPNQRVGRFDEMPADEAKALLEAMDSMSAPRKIWVPVPVTDEGPCYVDKDEAEMQWGCTAVAYHHDDVVRELIRAGSNMHVFVDLYGDEAMRSAAAEWRAALAKIAQEG